MGHQHEVASLTKSTNDSGIRTTCQFNTKIFYPGNKAPYLFSSDSLDNYGFDDEKLSFYADGCAITLNEAGDSYTIKSATNEASIVNLTFTRVAPGFHVGKDGKSYFGTDPKHPWGSMRHAFWPRCNVEGSIITKAEDINFKGRGFLSHALQGMKPHHAGIVSQRFARNSICADVPQPQSGILWTSNHQVTRQS